MLAALEQEVIGDGLGGGHGIESRQALAVALGERGPAANPRHQAFQFGRLENAGGTAQQVQLGLRLRTARPVGRLDHLANPILGGLGVLAGVGQQGTGQAREPAEEDLLQGALQRVQAGDAQQRIGPIGQDHLHHDRRALGDEHLVAQALGRGPETGQPACAAVLAQQPDLVIGGRALLGASQAVWQQEQTPRIRDGGDLVAPEGRGHGHHGPAEVGLGQAEIDQHGSRVGLDLVFGQRPRLVQGRGDLVGLIADPLAVGAKPGHLFQVCRVARALRACGG